MKNLQEKIYKKVRQIPKGSISTYKEIAKAIGNDKATRFVGGALSKNTDFKNTPCHRVIRSNGEIGGYAKGEEVKIRILKKEGIRIKGKKIKDLEFFLFKF